MNSNQSKKMIESASLWPPKAFDDLLNVFTMLYRTDPDKLKYNNKKFPKLKEIAPRLPQWTPMILERILISDDFVRAANNRGVPYWRTPSEQRGLTSRMMLCSGAVLDLSKGTSLATRLKSVGVTYSEYQAWMREPPFRAIIEAGTENMLAESYVDMQRALVHNAVKGDLNSIKFAYELMGKWDPNSKQAMEAQAVIMAVIEIIQNHVKDPSVLGSIASDMQMLAARAGIDVLGTGSYSPPVAGVIIDDTFEGGELIGNSEIESVQTRRV